MADTAKTDWYNGAHVYANVVSNPPMAESFRVSTQPRPPPAAQLDEPEVSHL